MTMNPDHRSEITEHIETIRSAYDRIEHLIQTENCCTILYDSPSIRMTVRGLAIAKSRLRAMTRLLEFLAKNEYADTIDDGGPFAPFSTGGQIPPELEPIFHHMDLERANRIRKFAQDNARLAEFARDNKHLADIEVSTDPF